MGDFGFGISDNIVEHVPGSIQERAISGYAVEDKD